MANYYLQFSIAIDVKSVQERAWLEDKIDNFVNDDGDNDPPCRITFNESGDKAYCDCEEMGNAYSLGTILQ